MNWFLAFVAVVITLLFFVYRLLVNATAAFSLFGLPCLVIWYFVPAGWTQLYWLCAIAVFAFILTLFTFARAAGRNNPFQHYIGWVGWINDGFIAWLGTLKYFTTPFCMVADPGAYKIKGEEVRILIDNILQPGDILLRGFDGYLDGILIRMSGSGNGLGKYFSHAALYLGDLDNAQDKIIVARRLQVMDQNGIWRNATDQEEVHIRNDKNYFQPGSQRVVHAMANGVFTEDILTFLRCDYLAVLRLPENVKADKFYAPPTSRFDVLPDDAEFIRSELRAGRTVRREQVVAAVHLSALGKIGSCYDFLFSESKTHHRFSCSEFVYYCFKSVHCYIGLELKTHAFMNRLFSRPTITPSDLFDAADKKRKMEIVWVSKSLTESK